MELTVKPVKTHLDKSNYTLNIMGKTHIVCMGYTIKEYTPLLTPEGKEVFFNIGYEPDCDGAYYYPEFLEAHNISENSYSPRELEYFLPYTLQMQKFQAEIDRLINEPWAEKQAFIEMHGQEAYDRNVRTSLAIQDDAARGYK